MSLLHHDVRRDAFAVASHFRDDFFDSLTVRGDTLFELTDALLCADGPVKTPVDLTLTAEHRRGHGAMYEALNGGNVDVPRLRQVLAGLPQPEAADGRLALAVDVTHWLRPDAPTSADRLFCHVYGRSGRSSDQFVPGWPYSFVAALESGRTSWCQILDALRLGPADDAVHGGRIDSLGIDENNAPAIVEYKRGTDAGVFSELGGTVQCTNLMPFGPRAV